MSDLKRIVRPELEKIVEEGIRKAQEREAMEFVSGKHPHYGQREEDRDMSKLGAKVYRNAKQRYKETFGKGRSDDGA
jgi:hypothetical protein